eukprot:767258-Hanusia_phi.AAC.1
MILSACRRILHPLLNLASHLRQDLRGSGHLPDALPPLPLTLPKLVGPDILTEPNASASLSSPALRHGRGLTLVGGLQPLQAVVHLILLQHGAAVRAAEDRRREETRDNSDQRLRNRQDVMGSTREEKHEEGAQDEQEE